jgi:hypothetical protein
MNCLDPPIKHVYRERMAENIDAITDKLDVSGGVSLVLIYPVY